MGKCSRGGHSVVEVQSFKQGLWVENPQKKQLDILQILKRTK